MSLSQPNSGQSLSIFRTKCQQIAADLLDVLSERWRTQLGIRQSFRVLPTHESDRVRTDAIVTVRCSSDT